jgi:aminoglycoside phosphotransferase family enzyme
LREREAHEVNGSATTTGPRRLRDALVHRGETPRSDRETHISWVVLTDEHAYKLKKPVRFAFVDLSTPEFRRIACETR